MPKHPRNANRHGPNIWVVRYRSGFSIKQEARPGYYVPPIPRRIAVAIARLIARANGSELIVQGVNGRITARDSHGADSFPPRG
jgi:hypothetical protein